MTQETLKVILSEAVYAPSGDNLQPWHFEFSRQSGVLKVFADLKKDNFVLNFRWRGTYIAVGALLENISITSKKNGFTARIKLFPDGQSQPNFIAEILFEKNDPDEDELYEFIRSSRTNRRPYEKDPISEEKKAALLSGARNQFCRLILLSGRREISGLAPAFSVMERVALENETLHRLFFKDIVWSETEEKEKKSGLYLKTLELPSPAGMVFRLIKYWPIMKVFNALGFSRFAAFGNASVYSSSGALGAIIMSETTAKAFVEAGRMLQRTWLLCTKLGLSFQIVTGIVFLAEKFTSGERKGFTGKHIALVENSNQTIRKHFDARGEEVIGLTFRIGVAKPPSATSSRKEPVIKIVQK
ncbi:MAG: hypothetical protein Q8P86_03035 [bacterium]|nr:hypothetical protein [bacterium]